MISIHAPRAGRDGDDHAGRRARAISIHAPRAGRDQMQRPFWRRSPYFNPRAPCGARQKRLALGLTHILISIHAPRAGRDRDPLKEMILGRISIHAPRAGRDTVTLRTFSPRTYFNPRAPCGARPLPSG